MAVAANQRGDRHQAENKRGGVVTSEGALLHDAHPRVAAPPTLPVRSPR